VTKIIFLKLNLYIYLLAIVFVSLFSFNRYSNIKILSQDKFIHFVMYFGLALLLSLLFNTLNFKTSKAILIVVSSAFFGFMMELCQEFFTTFRAFDLKDIYANTLGSAFGMFFAYLIKNFTKKFFYK